MSLTFQKPALVSFGGTPVTDHNRSPLSVDTDRIENVVRTAGGSLRKYFIADKHSFSMSWDMLPSESALTVDGFMGARALEQFHVSTTGPFDLYVVDKTGGNTYSVVFTSFEKEVVKRWQQDDYWNVSLSLEEV